MIPAKFEYAVPATLAEAVHLLAEHGDDAKVLTGGHSLVPMMKLRLARPALVVDLRKIAGLRGIERTNGTLSIGASTTHAEVAASPEVPRLLAETARSIGDAQVRNVGTIGGSLVHADPAADWPAAMLASGATMVLSGPKGERTVPADEFFQGLFESAAGPGEILTAIRVPIADGASGAYRKIAQNASGFALAGVAVQLSLAGDATIAEARVGVTGVADHAYRPRAVEDALAGCATDATSVEGACSGAADGVEPLADIHASGDYRKHLARVLAKRAVTSAIEHARGPG